MQITNVTCPSSKYSLKCPYSMTPEYITVHNTYNDASAMSEISYMLGNNLTTSFHAAVDDTRVVTGIPFNRNAWHSGDGGNGTGNRKSIGIEICYSKSGGDRFIAAEKLAAKYIAMLLKQYGWGIDRVKKHQDWSGKYCPHRTLDMGWDRFLNMVKAEMGETPAPTPTPSKGYTIKYVTTDLNERTGAGTNYRIVNVLAARTAVKVYEVSGNWARIENGMWVSNKYLANSMSNHIMSMEVTNCSSLNVRQTPNGKIVGTIPVNCVVSVLGEQNGWVKIGANKWVYKKYLK